MLNAEMQISRGPKIIIQNPLIPNHFKIQNSCNLQIYFDKLIYFRIKCLLYRLSNILYIMLTVFFPRHCDSRRKSIGHLDDLIL